MTPASNRDVVLLHLALALFIPIAFLSGPVFGVTVAVIVAASFLIALTSPRT